MIDGNMSIDSLDSQYENEIMRIADTLVDERAAGKFKDSKEAEDRAYDLISESVWTGGEREAALVLYCSEIPDAIEYLIDQKDYDQEMPYVQRAEYAMMYDVFAILWHRDWRSIGSEYQRLDYTEEGEGVEGTASVPLPATAVSEVLKYGFIVCDQLQANQNVLSDPDLAEVKLLRALERLKAIEDDA